MPDLVPNELNYETSVTYPTTPNPTAALGPIVRLDFPELVQTSANKRVVNVITDVEYDWPPMPAEVSDIIAMDESGASETTHREWVFGLYREEPTAAQVDADTTSTTVGTTLTIGNPTVIDHNVFIEAKPDVGATVPFETVHGTNMVKKSLQYMGIGTIVPNSYVWLVMRHRRYRDAVNWTAENVKVGCRIKYVQTTIPLTEWVGLYFSQQQLGDV